MVNYRKHLFSISGGQDSMTALSIVTLFTRVHFKMHSFTGKYHRPTFCVPCTMRYSRHRNMYSPFTFNYKHYASYTPTLYSQHQDTTALKATTGRYTYFPRSNVSQNTKLLANGCFHYDHTWNYFWQVCNATCTLSYSLRDPIYQYEVMHNCDHKQSVRITTPQRYKYVKDFALNSYFSLNYVNHQAKRKCTLYHASSFSSTSSHKCVMRTQSQRSATLSCSQHQSKLHQATRKCTLAMLYVGKLNTIKTPIYNQLYKNFAYTNLQNVNTTQTFVVRKVSTLLNISLYQGISQNNLQKQPSLAQHHGEVYKRCHGLRWCASLVFIIFLYTIERRFTPLLHSRLACFTTRSVPIYQLRRKNGRLGRNGRIGNRVHGISVVSEYLQRLYSVGRKMCTLAFKYITLFTCSPLVCTFSYYIKRRHTLHYNIKHNGRYATATQDTSRLHESVKDKRSKQVFTTLIDCRGTEKPANERYALHTNHAFTGKDKAYYSWLPTLSCSLLYYVYASRSNLHKQGLDNRRFHKLNYAKSFKGIKSRLHESVGRKENLGEIDEEKSRVDRYFVFSQVARRHNFTNLVVSHTANDKTENTFKNLFKASTPWFLSGFMDSSLLRPFLWLSRWETKFVCERYKLPLYTDKSNSISFSAISPFATTSPCAQTFPNSTYYVKHSEYALQPIRQLLGQPAYKPMRQPGYERCSAGKPITATLYNRSEYLLNTLISCSHANCIRCTQDVHFLSPLANETYSFCSMVNRFNGISVNDCKKAYNAIQSAPTKTTSSVRSYNATETCSKSPCAITWIASPANLPLLRLQGTRHCRSHGERDNTHFIYGSGSSLYYLHHTLLQPRKTSIQYSYNSRNVFRYLIIPFIEHIKCIHSSASDNYAKYIYPPGNYASHSKESKTLNFNDRRLNDSVGGITSSSSFFTLLSAFYFYRQSYASLKKHLPRTFVNCTHSHYASRAYTAIAGLQQATQDKRSQYLLTKLIQCRSRFVQKRMWNAYMYNLQSGNRVLGNSRATLSCSRMFIGRGKNAGITKFEVSTVQSAKLSCSLHMMQYSMLFSYDFHFYLKILKSLTKLSFSSSYSYIIQFLLRNLLLSEYIYS